MIDPSAVPPVLAAVEVGPGRYAVENHGDPTSHNVVFGGQLLAQMIMVAAAQSDDKHVRTINAVFARAGRIDAATEIAVDTFHEGRAFASHTLTVWQGDRTCARAQVMTCTDGPDLITHQPAAPDVPDPADAGAVHVGGLVFPGGEHVIVGDIDVNDSTADPRPAVLDVWYRSGATPTDRAVDQAVLAWATDGFLIGTTMLPHDGFGQDQAHVTLSTAVIDHTLTFHRPFALSDWVLLHHEGSVAGAGLAHGRCHVFDRAGLLVASYVQDSMIRPMPERRGGSRL